MDQFSCLGTILCGKDQFCFSGTRYFDLRSFVNVTISMSCQCDWLFPVAYAWFDALYNDRCTENRSVHDRTDRTVRTLPQFFQIVFRHAGCVWSDRCTFYSHAVFFVCQCTVNGNLVVRLISVLQSQIIVFGFQVDIREQKLILDHFPEDTGHLVSVHFNQWCCHFDFVHDVLL